MKTTDNPTHAFRIDNFAVPPEAREEFEATMRRNMAFIATLPGFRGHTVFEKTSGGTRFNIVTLATWDSPAALEEAGVKVRAHYEAIGFDVAASLKRMGVEAELGNYLAPSVLR